MKTIKKLLALCIIIMSSYAAQAQILTSSRPYLFNNVPEKLPAAITELEKAFTAPEGDTLQMKLNNFLFKGIITSSIKRYDNLYSVIIKSPSLHNTLFSISKRINDDKSITYVGRIINENYADGFELVQGNDGRYALNKIQTEVLLQDY